VVRTRDCLYCLNTVRITNNLLAIWLVGIRHSPPNTLRVCPFSTLVVYSVCMVLINLQVYYSIRDHIHSYLRQPYSVLAADVIPCHSSTTYEINQITELRFESHFLLHTYNIIMFILVFKSSHNLTELEVGGFDGGAAVPSCRVMRSWWWRGMRSAIALSTNVVAGCNVLSSCWQASGETGGGVRESKPGL
jgi:hypothetical protein